MNGVRTHTDCTGSCKSNYHTIMTMTAPLMSLEEAKYRKIENGFILWYYQFIIIHYNTLCYDCFLQRFIMVLSVVYTVVYTVL